MVFFIEMREKEDEKKVVYLSDNRYNNDYRGCFGYLQYERDIDVYG